MSDDGAALVPVDIGEDLRGWLAQFPLPERVVDCDMNQAEVAAAFQVSTNTVSKWISVSDFPIAERGGQGRAHVLRLSHVHAWREARKAADAETAARNNASILAMQSAMLNLDVPEGQSGLSAKAVREIASADLVHSQAAQLRRRLVRVDEVAELFEAVFSTMRDGIETMPDRLERELGLSPSQVRTVISIGQEILNGVADQIEEAELRERDSLDEEPPDRILI